MPHMPRVTDVPNACADCVLTCSTSALILLEEARLLSVSCAVAFPECLASLKQMMRRTLDSYANLANISRFA